MEWRQRTTSDKQQVANNEQQWTNNKQQNTRILERGMSGHKKARAIVFARARG